ASSPEQSRHLPLVEPAAESTPVAIPDVVPTSSPKSAVEQSTPLSDIPQLILPTIGELEAVKGPVLELAASKRPSQPVEPTHVTVRYANSLLEDSRFEEALQAFLELSHRN
ncbi:MAG: hypothetical protein WAW16_06235, partial [Candidatus Cryosericum sp.]